MLGNIDILRLLVEERNIDILCVSESWLTSNSQYDFVRIPGYKIFRCDVRRSGGVCINVKDVLTTDVIDLDVPRQEEVEDIWGTVVSKTTIHHYRVYLEDIFKVLLKKNKTLYVLGDFNYNLMDTGNKMTKLIKSYKLTQLVNKPTRITHTFSTY